METSGIYYWAWWDFLAARPNLARVLYNPRTTEHMTEVLSKRVRNELVDAHILAAAVRSRADYLLTLDKKHLMTDTLLQANLGPIIATPGQFLSQYLGEYNNDGGI